MFMMVTTVFCAQLAALLTVNALITYLKIK